MTPFSSWMIPELRESAVDTGDIAVVALCDRVTDAWARGRLAERADMDLIAEMWAEVCEV